MDNRVNFTYCRFSCDVVIFHNKKLAFLLRFQFHHLKDPLKTWHVLAQQDSSFCNCRAHLNFLSCSADESLFGSLKVVFTYRVVVLCLLRLFWIRLAFPTTLQFQAITGVALLTQSINISSHTESNLMWSVQIPIIISTWLFYLEVYAIWFLSRFGLKTGIAFEHFGLKLGMVIGGKFTKAYNLIFLLCDRGE